MMMSILSNPALIENPGLLDAFKIPDITNNIQQILANPELSNIVNILSRDSNKLIEVNNVLHTDSYKSQI